TGEFDHLIQIRGSSNVTVAYNQLDNPAGDGVLLGGEAVMTPSQNITIRNNRMTNPRRCNVAVIWARNVRITDNVFEKTNDFVTSVDIEPNPNNREDAWDIEVARNSFYVPRQGAVMLYSGQGAKIPTGGNISVHDNTGSAVWSFYSNVPANWQNVTVTNNF
ncbi:MAG: right-handed parallel beta-helix repeat-containing protein, partial [Deltaproteobacteria bacterium]|nr:right-handed parallel beta-helix repeat-containing protein [Deltaproteobacteria bacterium]